MCLRLCDQFATYYIRFETENKTQSINNHLSSLFDRVLAILDAQPSICVCVNQFIQYVHEFNCNLQVFFVFFSLFGTWFNWTASIGRSLTLLYFVLLWFDSFHAKRDCVLFIYCFVLVVRRFWRRSFSFTVKYFRTTEQKMLEIYWKLNCVYATSKMPGALLFFCIRHLSLFLSLHRLAFLVFRTAMAVYKMKIMILSSSIADHFWLLCVTLCQP